MFHEITFLSFLVNVAAHVVLFLVFIMQDKAMLV